MCNHLTRIFPTGYLLYWIRLGWDESSFPLLLPLGYYFHR